MEMVSFFISVIFEYMSIRRDPNKGRVLYTRVAKHLHKLAAPVSVSSKILFVWTNIQGVWYMVHVTFTRSLINI